MNGFFNKLFGTPQKEEVDERLSYTFDLDAWLSGNRILEGLYNKYPDVIRKVNKRLIEETIKNNGCFELNPYGEADEFGTFLPLSVDDEKVICREYYDNISPELMTKKTFKLEKIELDRFIPVVTGGDYLRNLEEIKDAIEKHATITTISYLDEEGRLHDDGACLIIPLRVDDSYLYCKRKRSSKEQKIKLKWIKYIQYDVSE